MAVGSGKAGPMPSKPPKLGYRWTDVQGMWQEIRNDMTDAAFEAQLDTWSADREWENQWEPGGIYHKKAYFGRGVDQTKMEAWHAEADEAAKKAQVQLDAQQATLGAIPQNTIKALPEPKNTFNSKGSLNGWALDRKSVRQKI